MALDSNSSVDELAVLAEAALVISELRPEDDLYSALANVVSKFVPQDLVVVNTFDKKSQTTSVRAMAGPEALAAQAQAVFGRPILGFTLSLGEEARQEMLEGKLTFLPGGLYQLAFKQLPLEFCRLVEKELGVLACYAQPFERCGDLLGTVAIFSRSQALAYSRTIEALTRLAAVAIHRQRAEQRVLQSERSFRLLAENSQDIVFRIAIRPGFEIDYISPAVEHILGWSSEIFVREFPGILQRITTDEESAVLLRTLQNYLPNPATICCRHRRENIVWLEVNLIPTFNEKKEIIAVEGAARDVTGRKRAEEALRQADRRKDEFLATLSHELRNPLAPIQNSLYILDHATLDSEQASRAKTVVKRQVGHMTRLINDLLDVTRIARGKITIQKAPVDVNELVRRTVEDNQSLFDKNQVALELRLAQQRLWVNGDGVRIGQAIGNLLQNSVKFTPRGGKTVLQVEQATTDQQVIIRVQDNGIGMEPSRIPQMFQPFIQGESTIDRSRGGLGLGLALVKGLVEIHQGKVEAFSAGPGKGSEFTIRLPLLQQTVDSGKIQKLSARVSQKSILIIEDNRDSAESLQEALVMDGHLVKISFTGAEGLAQAKVFHPQVVICDIGLPGMDGYQVAQAVRADPELRPSLLVALTGYSAPEDKAKAWEAGFDLHLAKPPDLEELGRLLASGKFHEK